MRFALIATSVAAAAVVPFAVATSGPQMSSDQFLSAVRCTAYADVAGADATHAKWRLNVEARYQAPETAAQAEAEAKQIALQAVNIQTASDASIVRAAACADSQLGANEGSAV